MESDRRQNRSGIRSWIPPLLRNDDDIKHSQSEPNESSPLLPQATDARSDPTEGDIHDIEDGKSWRIRLVAGEFRILFEGSIPVILAYTMQNSLQTISVLIVGRLSPEALAIAAFSYMFAMASGWLIALGGTTAIDTIASASFTGGKNKHDLGIILQRAFLVLGLFYIPVAVLWLFSEPFFKLLGQDDFLARGSAQFLGVLVPGGLGYVYFECMKKYLQAQEIMRPGTYVLLLVSPINAGLNYLFVYILKWGVLGAPMATGLCYWLSFILLVLYARYVDGGDCWGGFDRRCLRNIGSFAKIAFLGVIHVGTEWWAFEIVALAAGRLGKIPLAAQSVIMTADQIMNTIPFGVGVATSARVGNLLGSRKARGAARSANVAAWLSMMLGIVVLAVLMASRNDFARLFNNEQSVVRLTAEVLPYVALFQIADGLNGSCGGALRGQGRQHIGAAVNLVSYYMGALPLGVYLAFNGWGLAGLWIGQCIALYLVGILEWVIVAFSNWEKQVDNAFKRLDTDDRAERGGG